MKLAITTLVMLVLAGSALAASEKSANLTIRHQLKGCHSWSADGKTWAASQKLALARGASLTIVNNDIMPHTLIQLHGPKAKLVRAAMTHMGANARVTFAAKGTYVFRTKAGEDYPNVKGMETVGEDNVLRLVVSVQ